MHTKGLLGPLTVSLISAALVACGADDSGTATVAGSGTTVAGRGTTTVAGSVIEFEADPNGTLSYTADKVVAKAGKVTIAFKNPQAIRHVVKIDDSHGNTVAETPLIAAGSTSVPAELKPGTYTFYCSVPGHRKAGMEGILKVR